MNVTKQIKKLKARVSELEADIEQLKGNPTEQTDTVAALSHVPAQAVAILPPKVSEF